MSRPIVPHRVVTIAEIAIILHRRLREGHAPGVVRRPAPMFEGTSFLELMRDGREDEVLAAVRAELRLCLGCVVAHLVVRIGGNLLPRRRPRVDGSPGPVLCRFGRRPEVEPCGHAVPLPERRRVDGAGQRRPSLCRAALRFRGSRPGGSAASRGRRHWGRRRPRPRGQPRGSRPWASPTYPLDAGGVLVPHSACQPIGEEAAAAGLDGVDARSAAAGGVRELAWFARGGSPTLRSPRRFEEWY